MRWSAAEAFAEKVIEKYDVRCPGPDARIRLLSGGNMQKLILGRALESNPRIILANQPVRGLDIGAVTYVQERLIAARDAGAAILLISEDLDEIMCIGQSAECRRAQSRHPGRSGRQRPEVLDPHAFGLCPHLCRHAGELVLYHSRRSRPERARSFLAAWAGLGRVKLVQQAVIHVFEQDLHIGKPHHGVIPFVADLDLTKAFDTRNSGLRQWHPPGKLPGRNHN